MVDFAPQGILEINELNNPGVWASPRQLQKAYYLGIRSLNSVKLFWKIKVIGLKVEKEIWGAVRDILVDIASKAAKKNMGILTLYNIFQDMGQALTTNWLLEL